MYKKINHILIKFFGLKITRVIRPKTVGNVSQVKGKIIEFFGPSGVGKSTVCNYYLNHYRFKFGKEILTRKDLNAYSKGIRFRLQGFQDKVLGMKIENTGKKNIDPLIKYEEICHFKRFMDHDFLITHYLNDKIFFLDEERFLHYFLKDNLFTEQETSSYLKNRVFIFCYAPVEKIMKNIKKREKKSHTVWVHKNLNDRELYDYVDKQLKKELQVYRKLEKMGATVIKIDIRQNLNENRIILDNFFAKIIYK